MLIHNDRNDRGFCIFAIVASPSLDFTTDNLMGHLAVANNSTTTTHTQTSIVVNCDDKTENNESQ